MKKNLVKKSIGLIVSMAMMAGLMFVSGAVEAKAAAWPGEPEYGDEIKLGDENTYTNVTPETVELTVEGSVYKFYYVFDNTRVGGSPDFYRDLQWINSESCWSIAAAYTSFDEFKNGVVRWGRESVDNMANYGKFAYYKLYDLPTSTDTVASAPAHVHTWSWEVITEATETSDGLEGYVCSCGATKNTVKTPAAGVVMAKNQDKVTNAKDGETVVLELGMNHSLSRAFMEKIAEKRNTTFVIHSTYEHKNYEIVIPSGTPVVLDPKDEWFGILKQIEMFGMTEIQ